MREELHYSVYNVLIPECIKTGVTKLKRTTIYMFLSNLKVLSTDVTT